jgi:hypothetical protein
MLRIVSVCLAVYCRAATFNGLSRPSVVDDVYTYSAYWRMRLYRSGDVERNPGPLPRAWGLVMVVVPAVMLR